MNDVVSNLNNLLNKIYSSVENEGYEILEKISDINIDIFSKQPLNLIFLDKNVQYINLFINTIAFGFIIYYLIKMVLSLYSDNLVQNIYYFIVKVILIIIISRNSYHICEQIVNINSTATSIVESFLEEIADKEINYKFLKNKITTLEDVFKLEDKVSMNGLNEAIICIFIVSMTLIFSVRYVLVNICIILSPFCILMLLSKETTKIFVFWIKLFISNLLVQVINKIILFMPIVIDQKDELFGVILIGSIVLLYNVNKYIGRME